MDKMCYLKTVDERHYVFMPDDTKIPYQIETITIDGTEPIGKDHFAKVILIMFVELK